MRVGWPHYFLDDKLMKMQINHTKQCTPWIIQACKVGKNSVYEEGHVVVNSKAIK